MRNLILLLKESKCDAILLNYGERYLVNLIRIFAYFNSDIANLIFKVISQYIAISYCWKPIIWISYRECPKICLQSLDSNPINRPVIANGLPFNVLTTTTANYSGEYRLPSAQHNCLTTIHNGQSSRIHRYYVSHPAKVYCSSTLTHLYASVMLV